MNKSTEILVLRTDERKLGTKWVMCNRVTDHFKTSH